MITLIHGDSVQQTRAALFSAKAACGKREVRTLDGKSLATSDLVQATQSTSLFGSDVTVIIENLFSPIGKQPTKIKEYAALLTNISSDVQVILWEGKEVGKTVITALGKNLTVQQFKTPVVLFDFLDNIAPGKSASLLTLLAQIQKTEAPELLFALLVKRVRQMIMISEGVSPKEITDWQKKKLTNQSKLFTINTLCGMYNGLAELEITVKRGTSPLDFGSCLEHWVIEHIS